MSSRAAAIATAAVNTASVVKAMIGSFLGKEGSCGATARETMRASAGMALSVFCGENPDGAVGPDELAPACAKWPRTDPGPVDEGPVRSSVPVLLISGYLDPITPPSGAAEIAKYLPNSLHLVIRNGSHSYTGLSPCLDGIMASFIEQASVNGLDTACVGSIRRPTFGGTGSR